MTVQPFDIDSKTGDVTVNPLSAQYTAQFSSKCGNGQPECLELVHSWFDYPHIHAGFNAHFLDITTKISTSLVTATVTSVSDYDDPIISTLMLTPIVVSKDSLEVSCTVRGELYQGQLLYYTPDSQNYDGLGKFKCFADENAAKQAGYKKSFQ